MEVPFHEKNSKTAKTQQYMNSVIAISLVMTGWIPIINGKPQSARRGDGCERIGNRQFVMRSSDATGKIKLGVIAKIVRELCYSAQFDL
jgi:hypothetical protein